MITDIKNDLRRLSDVQNTNFLFIKSYWFSPGFRYLLTYRICYSLKRNKIYLFFYYFFRIILHLQGIKYSMDIPLSMEIGPGFRIDHFGGIWLSPGTKIGKNCSISSNVVMGYIPRGINEGVPISIGDNVYIGPGAKILGSVTIGNDVVIGANTVVTKSIPDGVTVFGIPGRIIAHEGSENYINNKV